MSSSNKAPHHSRRALATRVDELREALRQIPVNLLAEHTGASYQVIGPGRGEYRLSLFDWPILVSYPALVGFDAQTDDELPLPAQAVLAYYFRTSDGALLVEQWISFAELPDGRMYNQAFQGYTGDELVRSFGLEVDAFKATCEKAGGIATPSGAAAYIFNVLPRLPILVNYWCGDEDFPSSCKILFDRSVSHYLPTDVCAILGSMLTRRILKQR
jgi:Domain of unknown function (DUF3786)